MPPPGGFKPVRYSRNLPKGGPSSLVIALGSAALFTFGMYKVISANRLRRFARAHSRNGNAPLPRAERRPVRHQVMVSRGEGHTASDPALSDGGVRLAVRRRPARCLDAACAARVSPPAERPLHPRGRQQHIKSTLTQKEAELMASVPGWEAGASVYHSRYMKPMEKIGVPQSQKSIFGATS